MTLRFVVLVVAFATFSSPLPAQETGNLPHRYRLQPPPVSPIRRQRPAPGSTPCRQMRRRGRTRYSRELTWLILWNFLLTVAIALLLLTTKLSARIRDLAAALTSFRPLQAGIYAIGFAHYHVGVGFAVKLLRRFRARTSIWNVEPNLRRLVWRVAQSARYRARHFADRFRHSLFNLSSSPTHLVDLGNHLRNRPYYVSQHGGSGFHRTDF